MQVSIFEIARRQFTADAAIHTPHILPFALQRLFQDRELSLELDAGPISFTVLQWAFACGNPKEFFPGRFSLVPVKRPTDAPLAHCCLKQVTALYPHDLFQEERGYFSNLWGGFTGRCDLRPVANLPLETTRKRSGLWLWRARMPKETLRYDSQHDLLLAAILASGSSSLGGSKEALAQELLSLAASCVEVFRGIDLGTGSTVSVCLTLPQDNALGQTVEASKWAELGNPAIDRLLEACWRRRSLEANENVNTDKDEFTLSTLVIRRCGEPLSENEAYARFSFGRRQWAELERRATKEFEQQVDAVAEAALKLSDWLQEVLPDAGAEPLWQPTMEGLERLGFSEPATHSPEDLRAQLLGRRDGFPTAKAFAEGVPTAFSQSFRMSAVVSNRVMNSCLCELVGDLWSSPGLLKELKDYPRDTLLCEMAFFPKAVGQDLFYVPLMLPASRRSVAGPSAYFLSYAVAMCPPKLVRQDTFREVAENASEDLYLSFLEEADQHLTEACKHAKECQLMLTKNLAADARKELGEAGKAYDITVRDILRLADFDARLQEQFELDRRIVSQWGLGRLALIYRPKPAGLINRNLLERIERLGEHIFSSATAEMRYHGQLISKHLSNVEHSGLLTDLEYAGGELQRALRAVRRQVASHPCVELTKVSGGLARAAAEIKIVQSRWTLLPNRHDGMLDENLFEKLDSESCLRQFRAAVRSLAQERDRLRFDIDRTKPKAKFDGLAGHAVFERPSVLRDIFRNLLTNRIRHELQTIKAQMEWGIELRWLEAGELQSQPDELLKAWERWHQSLKDSGGACLVRAHPCSISNADLQAKVQDAIWGADLTTLGLWVLSTYTKAYDAQINAEAGVGDPLVPIASRVDGPNPGFLILLPGR